MQVKESTRPYQIPAKHMAYALQKLPATTADNSNTRGRLDMQMMQQLHFST